MHCRCHWGWLIAIGLSLGWSGSVRAFPVITSFSPQSGAPGTSVTITGTDLGSTFDVLFGSASAIFTVDSANQITTTVPLDGTSGPLSIFADSGLATTFRHFIVSPRITGFSPASAPVDEVVIITGANLEGATAVRFNGTNANFSVTSPTQVRAFVPAGATSGPISLTTPVGTATSPLPFQLLGRQPFISGFSPATGAPGTVVTITGVNFTGATAVTFNGSNSFPNASVTSPTQIRATVPPSASTGPIRVTTALGTGVSSTPFVVSTAPIIDSFFPIAGAPGTDVVIDGLNFLGATAVKFGDKTSPKIFVTAATQIRATVPTGATNAPITVTTPRGTGASFEHFIASAAPIITEFRPLAGPPGSVITVEGINFSGVRGAAINGVNAGFRINAPTQIAVTVPPNATSGLITLTAPTGTNSTVELFLVRTGRPVITGFDPAGGSTRSLVTIEGLDFTRATAVRFNGVAAEYDIVADTQISARVPAAATSGPISVTTPGGTVTTRTRFVVAPRIVSISPTNGVAGTQVTIRGTNLSDLTTVRFKEVPAPFEVRSTNEILVAVPDEAITGSINLISRAGIVATTNLFRVAPTVRQFAPSSGMTGTPVTVFGTGFGDVTAVRFGNLNAASFQVLSSTQLVAVVPARAESAPIHVLTASGNGASARSFLVGATADLVLNLTQSTNSPLQNQLLSYTLTVTNRGPAQATGVVVSNELPASVALSAVSLSQGAYARDGSAIRVNLGTLNVGATGRVSITVLPLAPGSITNAASVTARELDPDLADNAAATAALVLANPALMQVEDLITGLRISWPLTATNFVLQSTESLLPASSWQAVATAPIVSGDRRSVVLPLGNRNRFYRLHRP